MDHIPETASSVVFLDAAVPEDQPVDLGHLRQRAAAQLRPLRDGFTHYGVPWVKPDDKPPHSVKHSIKCFQPAGVLRNPAAKALPGHLRGLCAPGTESAEGAPRPTRSWRARFRGWILSRLCGHVAQQEPARRGHADRAEHPDRNPQLMSMRQFVSWGSLLLAASSACPCWRRLRPPSTRPDRARPASPSACAPLATKVGAPGGQFRRGQPADGEKDASGDWSVTVGPVEFNLCPYHFVVDGLNVADPVSRTIPQRALPEQYSRHPRRSAGPEPTAAYRSKACRRLRYGCTNPRCWAVTAYVVYHAAGL